jgi:L-arabinokinase
MRQSHVSYSRCGLGAAGTDRLVELTQEEHDTAASCEGGPAVFGAKITGGGSGGNAQLVDSSDESPNPQYAYPCLSF